MRIRGFSWPLVLTDLFWAVNFTSVKVLYDWFTPGSLALARWLVMLPLLLLISLPWRDDWRAILREWRPVFAAGALAMGIYMVLFMEGMRRISPMEGAIIMATSPLMTYGFSLAKRYERFSRGTLLGTLLCIAGVAFVVGVGHRAGTGDLIGTALVFGASFAWSLSAIQMRPLLERHDPIPLFTFSMFGALPVLLIFGLRDHFTIHPAAITSIGWAHFAQMTLGSGIVAFICFYAGVRQVGAAVATMYQFAVPALAALFAWWLGQGAPSLLQWAGVGLVIAGMAIASIARRRVALRTPPVTPIPASQPSKLVG